MKRQILSVMLSMAVAAFAAGNLRDGYDPGFEVGPPHWRAIHTGDPHAKFSKTDGIDGSGALVISSPNGECESVFFAKGF